MDLSVGSMLSVEMAVEDGEVRGGSFAKLMELALRISTAFKSCRFVWLGDFGSLELQLFGALNLPQNH